MPLHEDTKISVIVANFNHDAYILNSVRSVLSQSHQNIELIIVDDGSTNGRGKTAIEDTISFVKPEQKKLIAKPIFLERNRGKWFALNTAIARATGTLVTLCDADDMSHPQRLERQLSVLKSHGSYHNLCCFTHCYSQSDMDNSMKWAPVNLEPKSMPHQEVTKLVHAGRKIPGINHYYVGNNLEVHGASCLFYKQLWDHGMKFLPGNMGLRCQKAEDSDFNTKMTLLLQKTSLTLEPLYCYRRNTATNNAYLEDL